MKIQSLVSNFNYLIEERQINKDNRGYIGIIDVGAAGEWPSYWRNNLSIIRNLLRFEPRGKWSLNKNIVRKDMALWNKICRKKFYIYKGLGGSGSSLFMQNYQYVRDNFEKLNKKGDKNLNKTWFKRSQLRKIVQINCITLDSVLNKIDIEYHLLKVDAQGSEYQILEGSENFLKGECIAVYLETFKVSLYKGIKLFPDINKLLESYGFYLAKRYNAHGSFGSQNDCLYLKEEVRSKQMTAIKNVYGVN